MTARPDASRRPVVGLVVNPIAGLGGRVGLKGTDGPTIVARAVELGARPEAHRRAREALRSLCAVTERWPLRPRLLVAPGEMGEASAAGSGVESEVVDEAAEEAAEEARGIAAEQGPARPAPRPVADRTATTAADTIRLARALAGVPVDLLLFAGGDGTARDIESAVDGGQPVLGIPAGVKIHSAVFATSPRAAGEIAAAFLASMRRRTEEREVLDLDEDAHRRGDVAPRLHGYLRVPAARAVQDRKSPAQPEDAVAARGVAEAVVASMGPGRYLLGPGTTVRAIAERLGVPKTLAGIDVVEVGRDGARVVVADAGERELLAALGGHRATVVLTPIGGQGFLLGRGNQPLSPAVLRAAGRRLLVVATPSKLAALGGRPLLVDTGDPRLDRELSGHVRVVTGTRETAVARIEAA